MESFNDERGSKEKGAILRISTVLDDCGDPIEFYISFKHRFTSIEVSLDNTTAPIPMNISAAIAYAANSVVSKVILKKPNGQVTLFAFDAGEGLSEHSSPYEALVFVTDGTALISIAGTESQVSAGEMIILPANIPHAVHASDRFTMMLTMIK